MFLRRLVAHPVEPPRPFLLPHVPFRDKLTELSPEFGCYSSAAIR